MVPDEDISKSKETDCWWLNQGITQRGQVMGMGWGGDILKEWGCPASTQITSGVDTYSWSWPSSLLLRSSCFSYWPRSKGFSGGSCFHNKWTSVWLLLAQNSVSLSTQNTYPLRDQKVKGTSYLGPCWPGVCLVDHALSVVRLRT